MDPESTQALLTALQQVSDYELLEADPDEESWLLACGDTPVAVELDDRGRLIRLTGELGIEPNRAEEVIANPLVCLGMLRCNGDRTEDSFWMGLRHDDLSFVLTQVLIADGLSETDLAAHLESFVSFYEAWFEVAEAVLGGEVRAESDPPPPLSPESRV